MTSRGKNRHGAGSTPSAATLRYMDYFVGLEVSAHEMIADIAEETGRARADIKLELQLLEQQPETRHGGEPFLYVDVEIRNAPRSAKHSSWRTPVQK